MLEKYNGYKALYLILSSSSDSTGDKPYVHPLKASISFSYRKCNAIYGPYDFILSTNNCKSSNIWALHKIRKKIWAMQNSEQYFR